MAYKISQEDIDRLALWSVQTCLMLTTKGELNEHEKKILEGLNVIRKLFVLKEQN